MVVFGTLREMKMLDPAVHPSAFNGSLRIACSHFEDHLARIPQDYQPSDGFCINHLQPLHQSQPLSLIISLTPQSLGKRIDYLSSWIQNKTPCTCIPWVSF